MNGAALTQEQWVVAGIGWALQLVSILVAGVALWLGKRAEKKAQGQRRVVLREETYEYHEEKLDAVEGLRYHGTGMKVKVRRYGRDL